MQTSYKPKQSITGESQVLWQEDAQCWMLHGRMGLMLYINRIYLQESLSSIRFCRSEIEIQDSLDSTISKFSPTTFPVISNVWAL